MFWDKIKTVFEQVGQGKILRLASALAIAVPLACSNASCSAEVVEGMASIVNGDVEKARFEARQDAMRNFVEEKVGVHVTSSSQVSMGMLVSDSIMTNSSGYVRIIRDLGGSVQGNVYVIRMDLEASERMIETAVRDVKTRLEMMEDYESRSGIIVAVTGYDQYGSSMNVENMQRYVGAKMQDTGFRTVYNTAVRDALARNSNISSAALRRAAINSRMDDVDGNAILCGVLNVVSVRSDGKKMVADVHASFELIGLNDNAEDNFDRYFTAVGNTAVEAVEKAKEMSTRTAVETLGQRTLKTLQYQTRGGQQQMKLAISVRGINDSLNQPMKIKSILQSCRCSILRSSLSANGTLLVAVKATGYMTTEDLMTKIQMTAAQQGVALGMGAVEYENGTPKLYFQL